MQDFTSLSECQFEHTFENQLNHQFEKSKHLRDKKDDWNVMQLSPNRLPAFVWHQSQGFMVTQFYMAKLGFGSI